MSKKYIITVVATILIIVVGATLFFVLRKDNFNKLFVEKEGGEGDIVLSYAIHWSEKAQTEGIYENGVLKSKGLNQYLEEYSSLNPDIKFNVSVIPYGEYADTLKILSDADMAPDIYQIYSQWGVSYVKDGILNKPSEDIINDVKNNYISTDGVTINGEIWGIPTEINNFVLLYNKDIFREANLVDMNGDILYPKTWKELIDTSSKLTKKDKNGNIIQYGIAFSSEDWQVVDPFLSLLFSNEGEYLSDDLTKSLFNKKEGIEVLESQVELFKNGSTDMNGNFFDFGVGKVGMVIAPPWVKSRFNSDFGDKFESVVGVAPIPFYNNPATLGYSWFMGVMEKSKNKEEAWKFLKWFTMDIQPETGTTRYGDLLANTIGAIPARTVDFEGHDEVLGDFFTGEYVKQMDNMISEPNVLNSNLIKSILMDEIISAWSLNKTAKEALDDAALKIDSILSQNNAK